MLEQHAVHGWVVPQYFELPPCIVLAVHVDVGSESLQVVAVWHAAHMGVEACRAIAAGDAHGPAQLIPERLQHGCTEIDHVHNLQFRRYILQARIAGASQLFEREVRT